MNFGENPNLISALGVSRCDPNAQVLRRVNQCELLRVNALRAQLRHIIPPFFFFTQM